MGKPFPPTPELEKMNGVKDRSQVCGEFLQWLSEEKKVCLAHYVEGDALVPFHASTEQLLADFFGIDLKRVEQERRALLDHVRKHGMSSE